MSKIEKYGKSSAEVIAQKNSFFEQNDAHLAVEKAIAEVYTKQSLRVKCKNCDATLSTEYDFFQGKVGYLFCSKCHHLNGQFEDSDAFCNYVYNSDDGESYGLNYTTKDRADYLKRLDDIYAPKANFLVDVLEKNGEDVSQLSFLDFGAGSGYFVGALKNLSLNVQGLEISTSQVAFANTMLEDALLSSFAPQETEKMIAKAECKVFSMIGVLEHLQEPRKALKAIKENPYIEYLYISVPLFSLSVFLEKLSPEVFSRQLSGGHTHLYTKESLAYLVEEFELEVIGEWWFGSEMMDLYRQVSVMLEKTNSSEKMLALWQETFTKLIDTLQLEVDKHQMSSEVHMVLKKVK